jgi:hypothetical protein
MPVVKAFVHRPDNPNSRHVTGVYELLKEARQRELSLRRAYEGTAKAEPYLEKHGSIIDAAADANRTASGMAAVRRENEDVLGRK